MEKEIEIVKEQIIDGSFIQDGLPSESQSDKLIKGAVRETVEKMVGKRKKRTKEKNGV